MREAIFGALLVAAVSTLGDFVWAGLHLRHRMGYGLAHGAILFLCIGAYLGYVRGEAVRGALWGSLIGLTAAGSFYALFPVAGYSIMFVVWAFVWLALAFLGRPAAAPLAAPVAPIASIAPVLRGLMAMIGSGVGFYSISGIWRPFDPQGWDYGVHFVSWTIAYLPAFLALLVPRRSSST